MRKYSKIFAAIFWIALWQLAAMGIGKDLILPGPYLVLRTLIGLLAQGRFWLSAGTTLLRIMLGYLLGIGSGLLLAILCCRYEAADALLAPVIRIIRATPVASFIILALLWMGKARVPVLMAALMVLPIVWGNVSEAYRSTDPKLLEMARAYRLGSYKTLRYIYLPSCIPAFRAACLTSLGLAWKSGIAAEVLSQPSIAMGTNIYYSKVYLETPELFAWTIAVIGLSFLIELAVKQAVPVQKEEEKYED